MSTSPVLLTVLLGLDSVAVSGALSRRRTADMDLVAVWWPEIRDKMLLHPAKHAAEADLIITDATHPDLGMGPRVVCTHSDVFVLRVRRRIAEGRLSCTAVALIWVEPDGSERPIVLNERGTPDWWPKGVHAEAQEEFGAIRRALHGRPPA